MDQYWNALSTSLVLVNEVGEEVEVLLPENEKMMRVGALVWYGDDTKIAFIGSEIEETIPDRYPDEPKEMTLLAETLGIYVIELAIDENGPYALGPPEFISWTTNLNYTNEYDTYSGIGGFDILLGPDENFDVLFYTDQGDTLYGADFATGEGQVELAQGFRSIELDPSGLIILSSGWENNAGYLQQYNLDLEFDSLDLMQPPESNIDLGNPIWSPTGLSISFVQRVNNGRKSSEDIMLAIGDGQDVTKITPRRVSIGSLLGWRALP